MMRMQNRNSSCDCGKITKDRGSFVKKSKIYETRSVGPINQEDLFNDKDDVGIAALNAGSELLLTKMESSSIIKTSQRKSKKSFSYQNSATNLSKTSTNKTCDNNMLVTNGNARSVIANAVETVLPNESKNDILGGSCFRLNMDIGESNKETSEKFPQVDDSGKELRNGKQNGVYEIDGNEASDLIEKPVDGFEGSKSCIGPTENTSLENECRDRNLNGYMSECELNSEELDCDIMSELDRPLGDFRCISEDNNFDSKLQCSSPNNRKKRKTNFEIIFDTCAEVSICSDKRRNRRPPESYSPEFTRKIKVETPNDLTNNFPMSTKNKIKKKTCSRKRKPRGPIFHYLDLYIKNKDVEDSSVRQIMTGEPLIDEVVVKEEENESQVPPENSIDNCLSSQSFCELNVVDLLVEKRSIVVSSVDTSQLKEDSCEVNCGNPSSVEKISATSNKTDDKSNHSCMETYRASDVNNHFETKLSPLNSTLETNVLSLDNDVGTKVLLSSNNIETKILPSSKTSLCFKKTGKRGEVNKKKNRKVVNDVSKKPKKAKRGPGYYDPDISRILGYRYNNGKKEFLLLFHNGTSNWITQENNITIIPSFRDYFDNSQQDLSVINRLAYCITSIASNRDKKVVETSDSSTSDTDSMCEECSTSNNEINPDHVISKICDSDSRLAMTKNYSAADALHTEQINIYAEVSPSVKEKLKPDTIWKDNHHEIKATQDKDITCSPVTNATSHLVTNITSHHHQVIDTDCISNNTGNDNGTDTIPNDLNGLCNFVMSSRHTKLYPFETKTEVVFKKDGAFMHIYLKNLRKNQEDNRRNDHHLNIRACEKLISTLEDCAVDESCEVVVISGIEEYFNLKSVFEKLVKKAATIECINYEQDVSMLRYLIQTIRNFTKPITAVIRKTATGLPASMLSLFDMVFDERGDVVKKARNQSKIHTSTKGSAKTPLGCNKRGRPRKYNTEKDNSQNYLFPRLMGLTESNEAQIMGEGQKLINGRFDDLISMSAYNNRRFLSQQLRKSVRHMTYNSKIPTKNRGRSQSVNNSDEESEELLHVGESLPSKLSKEIYTDSKRAEIDNLEKEVQREMELTKRSIYELETILHSMQSG